MTGDFGTRGRRKRSPIEMVAGVGVAVAAVGGVLLAVAGVKYAAVSKARSWSVAGPPCASLTHDQYLSSDARVAHVFTYDDVQFGRGYGYVNCTEIADHGGFGFGTIPICQFNSPTVLQVTTARGTDYYAVPIGAATVSIEHGRPRCVQGASVGS
ncbi:MAG: hypothetical protein P4L73_16655 [Caulobacteraceae bacterium]|nr:hypothetical protein [Caulobacteraceae bacterium]